MADSTTHRSKNPLKPHLPAGADSNARSPQPKSDPAAGEEYVEIDTSEASPKPVDLGKPGSEDSTTPPKGPIAAGLVDKQPTVISKQQKPLSVSATSYAGIAANAIEIAAELEGEVLGYFQLGAFIGGGGMGAVFRAVDTMLDRTVAVKVLSRGKTDEEVLRRFKNEAQSAARLNHNNIAKVHYVGEDKGWNYIVFEYIEGHNIRELVEDKDRLPLAEAISYTLQIADALEHAAERDVVHRDIKPSNIIVTREGHAKLVDMGLARLHQVDAPNSDLTASGVTLGTFDYISPEQAHDPRLADVRSDLYSLGCTLYFMLTGRPPFSEGTILQKLLSHSSTPPPDPRRFRPKLPEELIFVVNKLLAKSPDDRYQHPSELINELLLTCEQLGIAGVSRGSSVWVSERQNQAPSWRRHVTWLIAAAAALAAVWGVDRFWPVSDNPETGFAAVQIEPPASEPPNQVDDPPSTADDPASEIPGPVFEGDPPPAVPVEPSDPAPNVLPPVPGGVDPQFGAPVPSDPSRDTPGLADAPTAESAADLLSPPVEPMIEPPADPEPTPLVEPVAPRLIVVAEESSEHPADELWVTSLAGACKQAAEHPEIEAIELRFNGQRRSQPFEIAAKKLVIRAGENFSPVIVFTPGEEEPSEDGFIRITGGELQLERVHLRAVLPEAPYHISWAMFHLDRIARIGLERCTLTIDNVNSDGGESQYSVAFFDMQGPEPVEAMKMPIASAAAEVPPLVDLSECVVRGEATLIRADDATPFRLHWVQGLFVSTHRLLETQGASVKSPSEGLVSIDLRHVTVMALQGAVQIERTPDAPHQLGLSFDCRRCIFITSKDVPVIEHLGVDNLEMTKRGLRVSGEDNFYPESNVVWRITEDGAPQPQQFDFDDSLAETMWYELRFARRAVLWEQVFDDQIVAHEASPGDFALSDSPSNPALNPGGGNQPAGFDQTLLPAPPSF